MYSSIQGLVGVGKPGNAPLLQQIADNLDALNGSIGAQAAVNISNGSFEVDSNSDGVPDNWTVTLYSGGSSGLDTMNSAHGINTLKFVHPGGGGNGGGYADSDYLTYSEFVGSLESIGFFCWSSNPLMRNQVIIRCYDKAKSYISSVTIYDSQLNATTQTFIVANIGPADIPTNTRFIRIRIVGGESSVSQGGTTFFDLIVYNPVQSIPFFAGVAQKGVLSIAEQTTLNTSYVDVGGAFPLVLNSKFNPVSRPYPIVLTFNADIKVSGNTGYQRFRVGTNYSNAVNTSSTSYGSNAFTLTVPANYAGPIIIYMQIYNTSGASITYGRKSVDTIITATPTT